MWPNRAASSFGTLYNTYKFFALYANVDGFSGTEPQVPVPERPEIDRWILSLLNTLIAEVEAALDDYEPTRAARAIEEFVNSNLSNWYVRLNRKRFWAGEMDSDKLAAYQTLHECLKTVALLMAPFAPFYSDRLYGDLVAPASEDGRYASVHLADFPASDSGLVNIDLERRMASRARYSRAMCSHCVARSISRCVSRSRLSLSRDERRAAPMWEMIGEDRAR